MSRIVVATAYGGPEVLAVADETLAAPGPGEARIEVRASGVNPVDYKSYSGLFGSDPGRLPLRLGLEAAGQVTAVGPEAIGPAGPVAIGDEVIAFRVNGGYAAELVVPAQSLVPKPPVLSWAEASGLMLAGATAWHALAATAVGAGDTVLVHGAAGGVGLMAIQLATDRGATVVGTASRARHDLLREFGAIPVAYGDGLADRVRAAAPQGVTAALDLVGTDEAGDVSLALVADRTRIATIAAARRGLELGIKVLGGAPGADPGTAIREAARLELARLAGQGRLRVLVEQSFPLENAADAHRRSMGGHVSGKIALIP
ncbi:MAG TPA: NADP-dependent oxidoreductase [Streptosporangiaceae bacterium]|nr:NADP-dependent oxidoreductase [Streptosporangiaceae bacterium]